MRPDTTTALPRFRRRRAPAATPAGRLGVTALTLALAVCPLLVLSGCFFGYGDGEITVTYSDPYAITIDVESVSTGSVALAITANFNCDDVPIYRNGRIYAYVNLAYNTPTRFTDTNVFRGSQYSYRAGGLFFLAGEVWSNLVTVLIP